MAAGTDLARLLQALPTVTDDSDRLAKFPTPDRGQLALNLTTRSIERYSGTAWGTVLNGRLTAIVTDAAYGAKIDGSTDDTAAIQAAVDAVAGLGGGTVVIPWGSTGVCRITQVTVRNSNITFRVEPGVTIERVTAWGVAHQGMLDIRGAVTVTTTTLSSTEARGQTVLSVADSSGFAAGDDIEIESNAAIGGQAPYLFETNVVESVAAGFITVRYPLRNTYTVTAPVVTLRKITPLRGIAVSGGLWINAGGTSGDCIRIQHALQPVVDQVTMTAFGDRGLVLYRCRGGLIRLCEAYAGADATSSWGVSIHSCEGVHFLDCLMRDTDWDGFDLSYGTMYCHFDNCRAYDCGDVGFTFGHGLHGHHNTATRCVAVGCTGAGFGLGDPSYDGDDDCTLTDCDAIGCGGGGFQIREDSARNRLVRCRAILCTGSGFATETGTTDTGLDDCEGTSCTVHGVSAVGRVILRGGRFRTNGGSGVRVDGSGAADSVLLHVEASGNGSHNILITGDAHRTRVLYPVVTSAANTFNGIHVTNAEDVLVLEPQAVSNGAYGARIFDSAGDSIGSRIVRGYFSGNTTAPVLTNNTIRPFTASDTTPSVAGLTVCQTANALATSITTFDDGVEGQELTILLDANTTLVHGATLKLAGGANLVGTANDTVRLVYLGAVWYQIGLAVNG